ncbi:MAG: hypothetical protein E3J47_08505 [Candidatus Stahlbacteria bacterium]|nr:MAG: hypothetical protein E3J47_08505 [Candidatus Stahlbacteria bacterium]
MFASVVYYYKFFWLLNKENLNNEEFLKEDAMKSKTIIYEIVYTNKDLIKQKKQKYLQTQREAGH